MINKLRKMMKGLTLVEVLIALVLLSIAVLVVLGLLPSMIVMGKASQFQAIALNNAQVMLEAALQNNALTYQSPGPGLPGASFNIDTGSTGLNAGAPIPFGSTTGPDLCPVPQAPLSGNGAQTSTVQITETPETSSTIVDVTVTVSWYDNNGIARSVALNGAFAPSGTNATRSPTLTATVPPTATKSITATSTNTISATKSITATPSLTISATKSITATQSITATPSTTKTKTISKTPTLSISATQSITATKSITATQSITATKSITATPSLSISATPSTTATKSITATQSLTATATNTKTLTATPTLTTTVFTQRPSVTPVAMSPAESNYQSMAAKWVDQ